MKPKSLLLEEMSDDTQKTMNENDEDAADMPDPEYSEAKELNLLQIEEGAALWTSADSGAAINEHAERQEVESMTKQQAVAEAMNQANEAAKDEALALQEVEFADKQSQMAVEEIQHEDYNADIPNRIHEHGFRAAMDERGYKAVASLKDNAEMEAFVRRAVRFMGFIVKDESSMQGIIPYYSGEKATQSFENLLLELERHAHDVNEDKWITPEEEEEEEAQSDDAESNQSDV